MDDIAENMNWEMFKRCEMLFNKFDIKPLLGVIPNNQDPDLLKYSKEDYFWSKVKDWQNQGWEISMHGYNHIYETETDKKDYLNLGGKSEFFGKSLEDQIKKIQQGLEVFKKKNVKIRSFYAPNHTYDLNTFKAIKHCGIKIVVDGYGLKPYSENNLIFVPQLFYRILALPFSFQTTQIHINEWNDKDFLLFEKFINKNYEKIISFDEIIKSTSSDNFSKIINKFIRIFLVNLRKLKQ